MPTAQGNIGHFVQNLYSSGLRYRKRMDELTEFSRFHNLPPSLRVKIHNYVDFAFSVTKGINVDQISAQLPAHLQLEIHLQLNKKMVQQVKLFAGCSREFYNTLVTKLKPCICVAGDYVFYAGEVSSRRARVEHA